jgi:DNA primase
LPKSQILYNVDHARHMPYVILVEGVTSVWRLGDAAVAALGKDLSERQARLLVEASTGENPVIVLLDGGEDQAIWTALHKLQRHRVPAVRGDLPRGYDPADFERRQLFGLIYEQARAQHLILPSVGATA